jgi:DNA invertase Pin-like site-specific DNA recombinase
MNSPITSPSAPPRSGNESATEHVREPLIRSLRSPKILDRHRDRLAIVYVRQSTPQQVQERTESRSRQYDLAAHAVALGWPADRAVVIDEDQGSSGQSADHRTGFRRLISEVTMDHVGLILGLEMSRLARSSKDWHHLLELCAVFNTLLADQDGVYNPTDTNDRLLLGLKGTMSEFEAVTMRNRLERGKRHKAERGELFTAVPVGYVRTGTGLVALDPDEQARAAVRLIFDTFAEQGSVYGVLHTLVRNGITLGVRKAHGSGPGDLDWRRPNLSTLFRVLHHPMYAGAYVYGRHAVDRKRPRDTNGRAVSRRVPRSEWAVLLRDQVPAYITWEQYETNQNRLRQNRCRADTVGVARSGSALLSGLLICVTCGRRMQTHYRHVRCPFYSCNRHLEQAREQVCHGMAAAPIDALVVRQVMAALEPAALGLSLRVLEDGRREREQLDAHWQKRVERARYEASRAERQYAAVEPENRLVARTLEQRWEEALRAARQAEEEYDRFVRQMPPELPADERARIIALSTDIPTLWGAPGTTNADRKEIIRGLVERVVLQVHADRELVDATIHWQGGFTSQHEILRPVASYRQLRDNDRLRARVVALHGTGETAAEIARILTREGFSPPRRRNPFSREQVWQLLVRFGLTRKRDVETIGRDEWWLSKLAGEIKIPLQRMRDWVRKGWVHGRQTPHQKLWIAWADADELGRLQRLAAISAHGVSNYPTELITPKRQSKD